MKCISYISKVATPLNGISIPVALSEIFSIARRNNKIHDITGVLSYRNGYYIQALEGPKESVDQLFAQINLDSRHRDVALVLDTTITKRSFPLWSMKLFQALNENIDFIKLMQDNEDKILPLSHSNEKAFKLFYDKDFASGNSIQSFNNKSLRLIAWPDLTVMKPSPVLIELSARLTRNTYTYRELLESKEFGTQQQLDKILHKLNSFDILRATEIVGNQGAVTSRTKKVSSRGSNSFYSKMKSFLGMI